jgi:hypothetical protein
MLDQVDNINWQSLGYPAMATWLRNISSHDPSVRKQAIDSLYDNQVTAISAASRYVIPFLLELLTDENLLEKKDVINLIMRLASECAGLPDDNLAKSIQSEIEKGADLYLAFLENPETRGITFELLGYLKGRINQIISILLPMLNQKENKFIAAYTINNLLSKIEIISDENKQEYIAIFLPLLADENVYVRIAAAMALSKLMKNKTPAEVDSILGQAVSLTYTEKSHNHRVDKLIEALVGLGQERAIHILTNVLPKLDNSHLIFKVLPPLLNLGFNNGIIVKYYQGYRKEDNRLNEIVFSTLLKVNAPPSHNLELNKTQRRILEAALDNDEIWVLKTNIFQLHGLPNSREDLRKLLG